MENTNWYSDWQFWIMIFAFIAIVLSQFPPIITLFKKTRLEVEPYNRLLITHTMGNPNANLFIGLQNIGSKEIKVKSISLKFTHADGETFTMPSETYFPSLESNTSVIMPPFRIQAQESWAHTIQFFKIFNREDEKDFRRISSEIRDNINAQNSLIEFDPKTEASEELTRNAIEFYNAHNKWIAGEYKLLISVETAPKEATITKAFRFTLYESDADALRNYTKDYKYGYGVYLFDNYPNISVPLVSA